MYNYLGGSMMYELNGNSYNVEVIKKNNKNIYIRVKENLTISVTCGLLTTKQDIVKILDRNKQALVKMINSRVKQQERNERFYLFGNIYDIIIIPTIDEIDVDNNYIYVKNEKMLENWVNNKMDNVFKERYEFWNNNFSENIPKYRLRYRKMKTRWGVCNKKSKTITLNTNLIKYDISCLDYVIVHELSHLIHFDHSKQFWELVEKNYPNYKQVKKLLK